MAATGDIWANLVNGFGVVLTPHHLLFVLLGVAIGTAIGVLPGIGPSLEQKYRRSLAISVSDYSVFFTRPISLVLMLLVGLAYLVPLFNAVWRRSRRRTEVLASTIGEIED